MDSTKIDLEFADALIVFRIGSCTSDKKLTLSNLEKSECEKFLKRINFFETMTWKNILARPREDGITLEKHETDSYKMIQEQDSREGKDFLANYYFHIRVDQKIRVFGYQDRYYFYITHIDTNHSVHK